MVAVDAARHDVGVQVENVPRPAGLEARQRRGGLRAVGGVRARRGNAEPPEVERGRGRAVAGAFDDPVDPSGIRQAARFAAQVAQASARVLPRERVLAGVDHENALGERPRALQLRNQVAHLRAERAGLHGACLDHQRDLAAERRERPELERQLVRHRLEALQIDGRGFHAAAHRQAGAGEFPPQCPFGPVHVDAHPPGRADPLAPREALLVAGAGRQLAVGFRARPPEREMRIAHGHDDAAVFADRGAEILEDRAQLGVVLDGA